MAKLNKKTTTNKINRTTEEYEADLAAELAGVDQPDAKPEKQVTAEQQAAMDGMATISNKIRYLDKEMFTRAQIAKIIGKRYQHVRNVLETPLKRVPGAK